MRLIWPMLALLTGCDSVTAVVIVEPPDESACPDQAPPADRVPVQHCAEPPAPEALDPQLELIDVLDVANAQLVLPPLPGSTHADLVGNDWLHGSVWLQELGAIQCCASGAVNVGDGWRARFYLPFEQDPNFVWVASSRAISTASEQIRHAGVFVDLDGDGHPEMIDNRRVVRWSGETAWGLDRRLHLRTASFVDIDEDGYNEIIGYIWESGTVTIGMWDRTGAVSREFTPFDPPPSGPGQVVAVEPTIAVADVLDNPGPEIVVTAPNAIAICDADGQVLRLAWLPDGRRSPRLHLANLNGDPEHAEILLVHDTLAVGPAIIALDGDLHALWTAPSHSDERVAEVLDVDRDGVHELLMVSDDARQLTVIDEGARTGLRLPQMDLRNAHVMVADWDLDGLGEIVLSGANDETYVLDTADGGLPLHPEDRWFTSGRRSPLWSYLGPFHLDAVGRVASSHQPWRRPEGNVHMARALPEDPLPDMDLDQVTSCSETCEPGTMATVTARISNRGNATPTTPMTVTVIDADGRPLHEQVIAAEAMPSGEGLGVIFEVAVDDLAGASLELAVGDERYCGDGVVRIEVPPPCL